jgi:plastocyanin/mono/diheme cytochrome c family protein
MSKRAFTILCTFAVIVAVVIPYFAITGTGDTSASLKPIASSDRNAQHVFQENCGACHTLAAAGTDGVVGPNLDFLLANGAAESQDAVDGNCTRVLNAVNGGLNGRMPKGILQGDQATEVANFVARNVNYLGVAPPTSGKPAEPITAASTKCVTTAPSSTGSGPPASTGSTGSGQPTSASSASSGSSGGGSTSGGGGSGASGGGSGSTAGAAKGGTVAISADPTGQLKFEQSTVTTNSGPVKIDFTNKSPVGHDVKIQDSSGKDLGGTDLVTGGTATATVGLQPGSYTFYCSVPGHEEAGMKGTLVVK